MDRVKGKVALVTGGAMGFGKADALMLAKEGAKIVVTDVNETEGKKVVEEIKANGGEAIFIKQDVSDEEGWKEVMKRTLQTFGKLDVLVNNAGVIVKGTIEETTLEQARWLMSVNWEGVFLGTKYGIETMKKNGAPCSIINMCSQAGIIGIPNLAVYCASKGAVKLLTKCAALSCCEAGYNIRVNNICPGYAWTPMVYNEPGAAVGPDDEARKKELGALHPIGRVAEPDDIAYNVIYLASDESTFLTGSEICPDGGYTAR
jgi:3(or 17)beta-hydroxysteroid dehydrogenase